MQENLLHIMKGTYVTGLGNSVGRGYLRINPFGFQGETAVSDSDTSSQCFLSEKDRRPLLSGHELNPHIHTGGQGAPCLILQFLKPEIPHFHHPKSYPPPTSA